jgi:hypothetical protein
MPLMPARASGVMINRRLGADMWRRFVATLIGFVYLALHLLPQFIGQLDAGTALEPCAHQLAQFEELRFLLVFQRSQRPVDHGGGIGLVAALDPVADLLLGLGGQGDAHRLVPPFAILASLGRLG